MPKINFSHPNPELDALGFEDHQLHVRLEDPELSDKLIAYLSPLVGNGTELVTIVSPGLAHLAVLVLTTIHGLTGSFPLVVSMVRGEDGGFSPLPAVNLQKYRNSCARKSREGLKVL